MLKYIKSRLTSIGNIRHLRLGVVVVSIALNIVLLMSLMPVDTVVTGCSRAEIRLHLFSSSDRQWMKQAKLDVAKARREKAQEAGPPQGIADGAAPCSGLTYKMYII